MSLMQFIDDGDSIFVTEATPLPVTTGDPPPKTIQAGTTTAVTA